LEKRGKRKGVGKREGGEGRNTRCGIGNGSKENGFTKEGDN